MSPAPLVSVVMSVYNGEEYLEDAIQSILNQTFRNFEFIIINDGSTDGSADILRKYEQLDARIHVYHQENSGLIPALNNGCRLAKGKYIARMDDDDISLPERFSKQAQFMETHPEIGIVDTWIEKIDKDCAPFDVYRTPTSPDMIKWLLFFGNPLRQSSVMLRREVMEALNFYSYDEYHVEDYDLFARASAVTKIASIPEVLSQVRYYEGSRYTTQFDVKRQHIHQIMHNLITHQLGKDVPSAIIKDLWFVLRTPSDENLNNLDVVADLILQLRKSYLEKYHPDSIETDKITQDAGQKLLTLARVTLRKSLWKSIKFLFFAVKLEPKLLFTKVIKDGPDKLIKEIRIKRL